MPSNKYASFRYRVIDQLLRRRRVGVSMRDLVEEVSDQLCEEFGHIGGVSESSIRKDISIMRSDPPRGYGAPIVCEAGMYRYSDPDYSIYKMPLSKQDLQILHKARQLMLGVTGMPEGDMLGSLISKFENNQIKLTNPQVIKSDFSAGLAGAKYLETLLDAILNKSKVSIDYQPFGMEKLCSIMVDPWLLKEFNGRWYLIGKSNHRKGTSVFGLDRIERIEISDQTAEEASDALLARYADVIGLSYPDDGKKEKVVLRFVKERFRYIETKPIHHSQIVLPQIKEGYFDISLDLVINKELISLILYYGKDVEVVMPKYLRMKLAENICSACDYYAEDRKKAQPCPGG